MLIGEGVTQRGNLSFSKAKHREISGVQLMISYVCVPLCYKAGRGICQLYKQLFQSCSLHFSIEEGAHSLAFLCGGLPVIGEPAMSWDCGLRYIFSVSPTLQQRSMCILHDKEDLTRLEMVQRLAKDGCRFLQNHSKGPERTPEVRSSKDHC